MCLLNQEMISERRQDLPRSFVRSPDVRLSILAVRRGPTGDESEGVRALLDIRLFECHARSIDEITQNART